MVKAISPGEFSAFRRLVVGSNLKILAPHENCEHSITVDAVPNTASSAAFSQMNVIFLELNFKFAI